MQIVPPDAKTLSAWAQMRLSLWPREAFDELRREAEDYLSSGKLDGRAHGVFLAIDLGAPIGMIEVGLAGSPEERRAHIEAWFVEPSARRRGVGTMLMAEAERWARGRGCRTLSSDTTPEYPESPAAHAALGFRARPGEGVAVLFDKPL
ncbi:MAG: GNAT family N-acetyltransferase [Phycisphaerales bacterium]|nr:GNAT family N-acetyltransferase [Phycisphaerales bacterium]